MTTPVTQDTFLSVYNDDYRDSDHYHRILFNSGRALQARELTQMQTIIQSELARVASFLFKEGGIFNTSYGSLNSGFHALSFVKVNSLPVGYDLLVGEEVSNAAGIVATVKAVIPATESDNNTLLINYTDGNNVVGALTSTPRIFLPNEVLSFDTGTISGTMTIQATNTAVNPATGKGSMIEVPQFNTFVAGHVIMVESQSLVLEKYNPNPTVVVGFKLMEEVVTAADNIALYDNSGATPNLTSPGADRYRINLVLIKETDVQEGETFFPVYDIIDGRARALKDPDNLLNGLGTILSNRTDDITGNFVVRDGLNGEFNLTIVEDSDNNFMTYKLSAGTAFVDGNRISRPKDTLIRVDKPRSLTLDVETKTNEFITARYGNFLLAGEDSAFGLLDGINNLSTVNLYSADDRGGTLIGSARIRNLDKFEDQYRIHLFDLDMDSNGSGSEYSLGLVRSIGTSAASYANITPSNGRYNLIDRTDNTLLFPMPRNRVYEISNVTMAVRRVYSSTTDGSGQATFSTGSANIFTDQENWIVSVDSSGDLFAPPTVSGTPNTATTITGLPFNSAVKLLGYETISATRKTKTLITDQTEVVSLVGNKFKLSKADIFKFTSVVDNTTSEDITYKFLFDNGQRDDFYTVGGGTLKSGTAAPAGTITVTFDYFNHTSGDYFGGKPSYPDIDYEDVPVYTTSTGIQYRLTDIIDMRSIKDNTGSNFTGTGAVIENIPKNTGLITVGTVKYWQPRTDIIAIAPSGDITNYPGNTKTGGATSFNVQKDALKLYQINLNPYVIDTEDLAIIKFSNRGYKMKDIEKLEQRISNLEEIATFTLAELQNIQTPVPDPNDATLPDRVKTGLTGDTFVNDFQSSLEAIDYRAHIHPGLGVMGPLVFRRDISLKYDSDLSTNTILKGSVIWPKYDEEVMINQNQASDQMNVNQFAITRSIGVATLLPNVDTWTIRKKVNNKYKPESKVPFDAFTISSQGNFRGADRHAESYSWRDNDV